MGVVSLLALLVGFSAHAQRQLLSAPTPLGGEFNKELTKPAWTVEQIAFLTQFSVTNAGSTPQTVKVTAYLEAITWAEHDSAGTTKVLPVPAQMTFRNFGGTAAIATWNTAERRFELELPAKVIPAGSAGSFDAITTFDGPITPPAVLRHLRATASLRHVVEIREDRGAINAALRIYGNNGFNALTEDANMQNFAPVFYPLNGGRPF